MASQRKAVDSTYAPTTAAAFYTCPAKMKAEVTHFSVVNVDSTTSYEVIVYLVPSGETVGAQYEIGRRTLIAERSDIIFEAYNCILEAGDALYIYCATASKITCNASVREFTE